MVCGGDAEDPIVNADEHATVDANLFLKSIADEAY
jgi:hypothetical protein